MESHNEFGPSLRRSPPFAPLRRGKLHARVNGPLMVSSADATEQLPLRLAFLGGGRTSAVGYVHRTAAQLDGRWVMVGGTFSADLARSRSTAEAWGIPPNRVYTDLNDLLSRPVEFDAVAVLTPTPHHYDAIRRLLGAGIPIICEKAITTSSDESATIRDLQMRSGGFLVSTLNYTGYPMLRELRARILRGDLGRILRVDVRMPQEAFLLRPNATPDDVQAWRRQDYGLPTISLDLGVHTVEVARFLHPAPVHSLAATSHSFGDLGVIDDVQAMVRFEDGATGSIWISKVALGARNGLAVDVYGEEASGSWVQEQPDLLHLRRRDRTIEVIDRGSPDLLEAGAARYSRFKAGHPTGFIEAFGNLYADIADALLDALGRGGSGVRDHSFLADASVAHHGMRVLDAIRRSAECGAWVTVEGEES